MDRLAAYVSLDHLDLAGVDPHADLEAESFRRRGKLHPASDGSRRCFEGREEPSPVIFTSWP